MRENVGGTVPTASLRAAYQARVAVRTGKGCAHHVPYSEIVLTEDTTCLIWQVYAVGSDLVLAEETRRPRRRAGARKRLEPCTYIRCLLYTSDAADE